MLHDTHSASYAYFLKHKSEVRMSLFWGLFKSTPRSEEWLNSTSWNAVNTNSLDYTACLISPEFTFSMSVAAFGLKIVTLVEYLQLACVPFCFRWKVCLVPHITLHHRCRSSWQLRTVETIISYLWDVSVPACPYEDSGVCWWENFPPSAMLLSMKWPERDHKYVAY